MKRIVSFILLLSLLFGVCTQANAGTFDISPLRNNKYLSIDVNIEGESANVISIFSPKDLSFTHSYESLTEYSYTRFGIIIMHYFSTNAYPVFFLRFSISTEDKHYFFNSLTITLNGKDYTFNDVAKKEWFFENKNSYGQLLAITFKRSNFDFVVELEKAAKKVILEKEYDIKIPVVFHGSKDIKGELDYHFIYEYWLFENALIDCNWLDYIDVIDILEGSNIRVKDRNVGKPVTIPFA